MLERCLFTYHSFLKFWEPPVLQSRIHGAKLAESGLGHNFWLECTSDLKIAFLNCIFESPFSGIPRLPTFHVTWRKSPGTLHQAQSTWYKAPCTCEFRCQVTAPGTSQKPGKLGVPEKNFQNAVQECLFQVASALQSKDMAQTWLKATSPHVFCLVK